MQRTLFDFARKTSGTSTTTTTTKEGAKATAAAATSSTAAPAHAINQSTDAPSRKRPRRRSRSAEHTGATAADPIDLAENSCIMVSLQEATTESTPGQGCGAVGGAAEAVATSSRWLADLITEPAWKAFLQPITSDSWRSGGFQRIEAFLDAEAALGKVVLPPAPLIFSAFNSCPFADLKVVLLGQDPYHNLNQAHGLCFSVLPGVQLPPSLKNMYKELTTDVPGFHAPSHGYLQSWAEQGMLMLNATLTVEAHKANSHSKASGWPAFTDAVITRLSQHHPNRLVFLLWGSYAQHKKALIDTRRHVVIESVHPSPLSAGRGWFGCHCFSACNRALVELGHLPMYWQLPLQVQPK